MLITPFSQATLKRMNDTSTFCHLAKLGFNRSNVKKMNPHIFKDIQHSHVEFKRTPVRAALGWFRTTKGQLTGNLAYQMYIRIRPDNKDLAKPIIAHELLSAYVAFSTGFPLYLADTDLESGIEINRFYNLLESIRVRNVTDFMCNKCGEYFMKAQEQVTKTCPHCQLSSRKSLPIPVGLKAVG